MHRYRSHTCGALSLEHTGQRVRLSGWLHRARDHGGLLFMDLRDHYGITQCVVDQTSALFAAVQHLPAESVLRVDGQVVPRAPETVNPELATGRVEVRMTECEVLSRAEDLPLPVFGDPPYPEETRLRYRYLDLRRAGLHDRIQLRAGIIAEIRRRMTAAGFTEFQTPILTASSPEGARDFLVPSRLHPGMFYALPQAPQQFKQMIMIAGFDRYFQIAPCFRDEDARADRSPGEFYQLDVEMSFVEQEDVLSAMEPVLRGVFETFSGGRAVTQKFPRIPYAEAMRKYGTDKPDLRNPVEMHDVTACFRGSGFALFAQMIERNADVRVWAIPAKTGGSRAFCDRMNSWAQDCGQPGMGYVFFRNAEGAGPVARNLGPERTAALRDQLELADGDAVFFCAGTPAAMSPFAASARDHVARALNLVDLERFAFCWITDYPLYAWNAEEKKIEFSHNPFSMPQGGLEALETQDPLQVKGFQYDIVCNGVELSSGAVRNHLPQVMFKAFEIAGYTRADVERQFSGMINALRHGAPPHGGIAPGIDRMVMLLAGMDNLREVVMFPLNQQGQDLLMGAPGPPPQAS